MQKPRFEGGPSGAELAKRIDTLLAREPYASQGAEKLAVDLGVSLATVYRWRGGEAKRISRAVARNLAALEVRK